MRNNLKKIISLMLVVLCVASFSVTAFAAEGGEVTTTPDVETTTDTEPTVTDETEAPATDETEADFEIPFNYTIDNDGNLIITIEGATDPAEITTTGTVVTNGARLNLRTGAGLDFEIIDQLRPGEEVTVIGSEGDWYEVVVPEKKGYVHGDYLELIEKAEQNSELDLAMLIHLMEMMFGDTTGFESIFGGLFGTDTDATEDGKPPFAFTPDGNLTLIDDFLQIEAPATEDTEQIEKQFITVQSKNGNTFYIVIDRNGETENVYFLNLVDEADLMALMESEEGETAAPTCSCTDKCVVGAINTNCEICRTNMSECTGKEAVVEPEPEPAEPAEEPDEEKKPFNFLPIIILVIAGAAGGAVYWFKFRKPKTKTSGNSDLDDYDFGEDDEDYDEETELDDADVMAEAESEDEDA